jgi:hypothetical protein
MHALHTSSTWCGVKMKMHDSLLADHAVTSHSSADASSPCPKLQSTQYTFGQQTPNSRSSDPTHRAFNTSPLTLQTILLHSRKKLSYDCDHVPSGTALAKVLTDTLCAHIFPDTSTFEDKAIQWFRDLLLNKNDDLDDKIGFNNSILIAYGMCPPCELLVPRHELSLIRSSSNKPTYFMRCPSNKIWEFADA